MFQNHNSIGQNNTEQNNGRQNNTWISASHRKTSQHRPFCSHHKSIFPTQDPHRHPNTCPNRTPACTTLSKADPHPPFLPPSSFSQGTTSHALGKQPSAELFQKNSMKSKLFGTPPPHKHPNRHPPNTCPKQDQACTTLSKADPHPPFLPPSSFSQGTTSHALGKQPSAEPFQKV